MNKKLNGVFAIVLTLVAMMTGQTAWAQESGGSEEHPWVVTNWADLKTKMAEGGYIRLDDDVSDPTKSNSSYLDVPSGVTVTMDLNGHTIDRALTVATSNGYVINVVGTLTVNDSSNPSTGTITGGWNRDGYGAGIYVSKDASLILNNGSITGNKNEKNSEAKGGGVYVGISATFTMNGGSITNNLVSTSSQSNSASGGGVYVHSFSSGEGTFNMNGGVITGNSVISNSGNAYGGGVLYNNSNYHAHFNLQGNCTITGNTGIGGVADNVYVNSLINLSGALDAATRIGITATGGTQIIGYQGSSLCSLDNFTCDKTGFALQSYNGIRIMTVGVFVAARDATCTDTGISQDCWLKDGHYYSDQACTQEINPITAALGHDMTHYTAVAPTETANGNVEYWFCTRCSKYFLDSNGDTETSANGILVGPSVNYIDVDGVEKSQSALILTGTETILYDGWYVAIGNVSFDHTIHMEYGQTSNVKIILADGVTMNIGTSETPLSEKCINHTSSGDILSIYGQANGTGTLAMYSEYTALDIPVANIYSGHVTAQGGTNNSGINAQDGITITGGNVHATGGYKGISSRGSNGTITLGWTNPADRIYANEYQYYDNPNYPECKGSLIIATGQYLYNGTEVLSGTIDDLAKVNDKTLQPAVKMTLPTGVTASGTGVINQTDGTYVLPGTAVTLSHSRDGCTVSYASDEVTVSEGGTFTMPATDVTVSATFAPDPDHFADNGDGSYTIKTATGWSVFCDALQDNDTYNRFSGKTVNLAGDIGTAQNPITRMAGSSEHEFCGTFDGLGHTLTIDISSSGNYTAIFSYVSTTKVNPSDENNTPAAIRNLKVAGNVNAADTHLYAGGLVGTCNGVVDIENSLVSTVINSQVINNGSHGGIVGYWDNGTLTISGCVFDGKLLGSDTNGCGGFVGLRNHGIINIYNSLFAPAEVTISDVNSVTFVRFDSNTYVTVTNSYYTQSFGYDRGKQGRRITAGANVTVANAGTVTEYDVSGITSYGTSIKYDSNLYADWGDEVSLTLTNTPPTGYTFSGYFASAGTLSGSDNPYTLTMPSADVTISAVLTSQPITTSYVDADGTLHENISASPLDNTMTTLAGGWYVVNSDVNYTGQVTLLGDVNLILGDGKTMTVTNTGTDNEDRAIYGESKALHIYGQSQGTGTLTATAVGGASAIVLKENNGIGSLLGIHGGVVTASTSYAYGSSICVQCASNTDGIVIDGGQVTALADGFGIISVGGHFDILGGQVTATGTNDGGLGICDNYTNPGVLTLGCSKATDFISTNKIYNYGDQEIAGEVKIVTGQTLADDGGKIWSGTLTNVDLQAILNKTLRPVIGLALTKDGSGDVSAEFDGTSTTALNIPTPITVQQVTYSRTFSADKASTVMLPFNYTCNGTEGGTFYRFVGVEQEGNTWVATMQATGDDANNAGTLIANTPYLFMPTGTAITFSNIPVGGVTLNTTGGGNSQSADAGSHWTFKGTYETRYWYDGTDGVHAAQNADEIGKAYGFAAVAKSSINVGDFVKVANGAKMRPMSCYLLWDDTPNSSRALNRAAADEELPQSVTVRLVGANGEVTRIGTLDTATGELSFDGWYDMSGRRLDGKPTKKGLYINNGKKVVIK